MLQTILVPVDGTGHADKAIDIAADLGTKHDAKLIFLYAIPDREVSADVAQLAALEHVDGPLDFVRYNYVAESIIRAAEEEARLRGATKFESVYADGDPAEAILKEASDRKADMIVMGSRGLSGLQSLLRGSVSHNVAEQAPCTCVTVR